MVPSPGPVELNNRAFTLEVYYQRFRDAPHGEPTLPGPPHATLIWSVIKVSHGFDTTIESKGIARTV